MSVLQKLIVVPTLHKMTYSNVPTNSTSTGDKTVFEKEDEVPAGNDINTDVNENTEMQIEDELATPSRTRKRKENSRPRWTVKQRKLVFKEFGEELLAGNCPPRIRVVMFYRKNRNLLQRNETSVYTYIHNIATRKQKIYTPDKKMLKKVNLIYYL